MDRTVFLRSERDTIRLEDPATLTVINVNTICREWRQRWYLLWNIDEIFSKSVFEDAFCAPLARFDTKCNLGRTESIRRIRRM